jgi:hypothetical protein
MYFQETALAVDVGCFQADCFGDAQAAGIDDGQSHAKDGAFDLFQDDQDFIRRQHYRQSLAPERPDQIEDLPVSFQGGFIKELDAAQIDGNGAAGRLEVIDHVNEEPADFIFGEQVR